MTPPDTSRHHRATATRSSTRLGLLCGLALLAGCASSNPAEETFPAPDYSYLPPLNLNVGQVEVANHARPDSKDLAAKSPANPADTLALMGHQRLHATGTSGQATFLITRADMHRAPHHSLSGSYTVRLSVDDQDHGRHGHVTAHVQRQIDAPEKLGLEHNLHTLNTQLMDDMNVELEYQVRSHLASWMTDATGTPLNATIQSQDLTSPSPTGTAAGQAGTTASEAAGTAQQRAATGTSQAESSLQRHSPPPGVLTLPQH